MLVDPDEALAEAGSRPRVQSITVCSHSCSEIVICASIDECSGNR